MSWREREFSHESEAYYRSLDQVSGSSAEACMGGHIEDGKTVCDWFQFTYEGGKVKVSFRYLEPDNVIVSIEGIRHRYPVPRREQAALIRTARELALKVLKEQR